MPGTFAKNVFGLSASPAGAMHCTSFRKTFAVALVFVSVPVKITAVPVAAFAAGASSEIVSAAHAPAIPSTSQTTAKIAREIFIGHCPTANRMEFAIT